MKIVYVANARIPTEKAHGIQIMKTCEALACLGHKVELVVPWRRNPIRNDPFQYYRIERNFTIRRIPSADLVFLGKFGFWIQALTFAECATWYLLFKRADLFYGRDEITLSYLALFGRNVHWEAHLPQWNPFVHMLTGRAQGIVTISQGLKNFFATRGVNRDKITVIPDGVDTKQFLTSLSQKEAREKLGLPQEDKIVMYTGHLYDWKGTETLILASLLIMNTKVYLVGGTDTDILRVRESFDKTPSVLSNLEVEVVGRKPHEEIPLWLAAADVLVLPNTKTSTISALYTSPLKLFEYMASGRPIVASDVPSTREVLSEEDAFWYVPDSPVSLADTVRRALNDPDARTMAERVKEKAQDYDWQKRAEKILDTIVL